MSTLTGGDLNLVKPALTDDHKVTIGTDLPANFQKIDDEFTAHLAETATDEDGVHGLEVETGLWTPSIVGATVAGTNTYAVQFGKYVKENKKVTLKFDVEMSNKDANMSGSVRIVGLPFAADINARYFNVIIVLLTPGLLDKSIVARVDGAVMTLAYGSGSWVVLDATTIVDKSVFAGEIIYFTN